MGFATGSNSFNFHSFEKLISLPVSRDFVAVPLIVEVFEVILR
jgi:hypothetical protein